MTGIAHFIHLLHPAPFVPNAIQNANPPKQIMWTTLSALKKDGICSMVGIAEREQLIPTIIAAGIQRAMRSIVFFKGLLYFFTFKYEG